MISAECGGAGGGCSTLVVIEVKEGLLIAGGGASRMREISSFTIRVEADSQCSSGGLLAALHAYQICASALGPEQHLLMTEEQGNQMLTTTPV